MCIRDRANTGNKLYIQEDLRGKNVDKIKALAAEKKVSISWTPKKTLQEMTEGAVHQGFVLRVAAFAYTDLAAILKQTAQEENPLLLILDGLTDPHNLGSILRTADATNVSGVIIPKHRAVGVTPVVSKTSTGAVEHIPICLLYTSWRQAYLGNQQFPKSPGHFGVTSSD